MIAQWGVLGAIHARVCESGRALRLVTLLSRYKTGFGLLMRRREDLEHGLNNGRVLWKILGRAGGRENSEADTASVSLCSTRIVNRVDASCM